LSVTGIHHVDLAVRDVERSQAFYMAVFGPLGAAEAFRYPTYRGSEEVVYLRLGGQYLGLRPADGGDHRYYDVGIEHLAVFVESREEVGAWREKSTFHRKRIVTSRATGRCSSSIPTAFASRWRTGRAIHTQGWRSRRPS
jgi:catechol 2,3-dioxygenase-like lactoylglutathione lyase family enzyme